MPQLVLKHYTLSQAEEKVVPIVFVSFGQDLYNLATSHFVPVSVTHHRQPTEESKV